jgi:hypothetical protein
VYEARKAFEQYDAVDARNRLAASELERRWNGKLEEIEAVKQRLSSLETERYSLSPEEETALKPGPSQICRPSPASTRPSNGSMIPTNVEPGPCRVRLDLAAETTREPPRRYVGSCHEAEQWTKAHERERTCEMETGDGRFEIDITDWAPALCDGCDPRSPDRET